MSFLIGFVLGLTLMYFIFSYYIRQYSKGFFNKFIDNIFDDDDY